MTKLTSEINTDQQRPDNHTLVFDKYADITYFITDLALPDVFLGRTDFNTPRNIQKQAGTSLDFSDLIVTFIINEDFSTYKFLFYWMQMQKYLTILDASVRAYWEPIIMKVTDNYYGNANLNILTNHKNLNLTIRFFDIFPIGLSSMSFSTKMGSDPVVCDATFSYNRYDFV